MTCLQSNKLVLLILFIGSCTGLTLIFYSWYQSYPVSIVSPFDFVFNHISSFYWVGLPVLFASLYVMATKLKSNGLILFSVFGIVMSTFSLSYFYYFLPGSDSQAVRGLTEYFFATGDLDPSKPHKSYFQWPIFFILEKICSLILGLELRYLEFILYTIIGFLWVVSLYVYASKFHPDSGYIAVISLFIASYYFINYQCVPYSLAIGLLMLLFMFETSAPKKIKATMVTLIIFTSISLMHAFVCIFFILYTLIMYLIERRQKFLGLFILELIIYFLVLMFLTQPFFMQGVGSLTNWTLQYGFLIRRTFWSLGRAAPRTSIDLISQAFSRAVTIVTAIILGVGFILLLMKRELRQIDYAIFLSGAIYSSVGLFLDILGDRSFFIIAIPVSLGATYFFESKFMKYFKVIFLILVVLFTFIPLSSSYLDNEIMFQTREAYQSANFMLDNYSWTQRNIILSHIRLMTYLSSRKDSYAIFVSDFSRTFPESIETCDYIFYTVGLEKSLLRLNLTERMLFEIENRRNIIFNSGASFVAMKPFYSSR